MISKQNGQLKAMWLALCCETSAEEQRRSESDTSHLHFGLWGRWPPIVPHFILLQPPGFLFPCHQGLSACMNIAVPGFLAQPPIVLFPLEFEVG